MRFTSFNFFACFKLTDFKVTQEIPALLPLPLRVLMKSNAKIYINYGLT